MSQNFSFNKDKLQCDLAHNPLRQGQFKQIMSQRKSYSRTAPASLQAVADHTGLVWCRLTGILRWQVKDAASQLEFLKEVGSAGVGSLQAPDLLYLQGLLTWKQGQDLSQVMPSTTHTLHGKCHLQQPDLTETNVMR